MLKDTTAPNLYKIGFAIITLTNATVPASLNIGTYTA